MQLHAFEKLIEANRPEDWELALGIAVTTLAALAVVKYVVACRVATYARGTATRGDDVIVDALPVTTRTLHVERNAPSAADSRPFSRSGDSA